MPMVFSTSNDGMSDLLQNVHMPKTLPVEPILTGGRSKRKAYFPGVLCVRCKTAFTLAALEEAEVEATR